MTRRITKSKKTAKSLPSRFRRFCASLGLGEARTGVEAGTTDRGKREDEELQRHRDARAANIKTILFVCSGNAIRSQIAEALVNHAFRGSWAAFSGGTTPMEMPPDVSVVMQEIGIDTTGQHSKQVAIFSQCYFDRVIILCSDADRFCRILPVCGKQEHMHFEDPLASVLSEGIVFNLGFALRGLRDEMQKAIEAYLRNT
jgi:protein-tyrosine-phosphatase